MRADRAGDRVSRAIGSLGLRVRAGSGSGRIGRPAPAWRQVRVPVLAMQESGPPDEGRIEGISGALFFPRGTRLFISFWGGQATLVFSEFPSSEFAQRQIFLTVSDET